MLVGLQLESYGMLIIPRSALRGGVRCHSSGNLAWEMLISLVGVAMDIPTSLLRGPHIPLTQFRISVPVPILAFNGLIEIYL